MVNFLALYQTFLVFHDFTFLFSKIFERTDFAHSNSKKDARSMTSQCYTYRHAQRNKIQEEIFKRDIYIYIYEINQRDDNLS